jgi:hypothetical protein
MNAQDFEGTWVMQTHNDGYYEHELRLAVDGANRVTGSWRHLSRGGGESSVDGDITDDRVRLTRTGRGINQTFMGRCTPTFAGGTYDGTGVWFMEKR